MIKRVVSLDSVDKRAPQGSWSPAAQAGRESPGAYEN